MSNNAQTIVTNTKLDGYPAVQQCGEFAYKIYVDYWYVHRDQFNIQIKEGYKYDGASIPRFWWRVAGTPFTGKYTVASLVHDALYSAEIFPRKKCDLIFLEIMEDYKVGYFSRLSKYNAVRWFGWSAWHSHNVCTIEKAKRYITLK